MQSPLWSLMQVTPTMIALPAPGKVLNVSVGTASSLVIVGET
jgi:hypothetical protein